eukprot:3663876-Prymnesium_polylepis.1
MRSWASARKTPLPMVRRSCVRDEVRVVQRVAPLRRERDELSFSYVMLAMHLMPPVAAGAP